MDRRGMNDKKELRRYEYTKQPPNDQAKYA